MAGQGCKENHPMDKCELLRKLTQEKMLVKLQEERMCLYCFWHRTDLECFA
jgi:hypothetical protein